MFKAINALAIALCTTLTAFGQCSASFVLPGNPTFCSNQVTALTNGSSSVDSSRWTWSGANSGSSSGIGPANFSATLSNPGNTTVCLTVYSAGCVDSLCRTISITSAPPVPSFTVPSSPCSGTSTNFSVSGPVGGTTYTWNFGSGQPVTGTTVSHVFNSIGGGTHNFSVTLTATRNGCSSSVSQTVVVRDQPDANIADVSNAQQFTNCGGGALGVEIVSMSTTQATNATYTINWGDGSSAYSSTSLSDMPPGVTHNYTGNGYFTIVETVTANGCSNSASFSAFNGTNPSGSLGNPGGTTGLCSPATLSFPINGVAGNTPGTQYIITVNDGSHADTFSQPPPASYTHIFSLSSCGYTTPSYSNSFFVRMQAVNQCNSSTIIVDPITINSKPQANFSISPDTVVCVNSNVTFTNTSIGGALVSNSNLCDSTNIPNWVITPSTGHTVVSGTEGSNPPTVVIPATWGSNALTENFTVPGVYSIKLKIRSKATNCGTDSITKTICVLSPPTPQFSVSPNTGCAPFVVSPSNTSTIPPGCAATSTAWTVTKTSTTCSGDSAVDYRFIGGTTAQSANSQIRFNNSGTYTLNLTLSNKCGSFPATAQTITVKTKPVVAITSPAPICATQSATLSATAQPCGGTISNYSWSFQNGTPSTSTSTSPIVSYPVSGTNTIGLTVTNECGTGTAASSISVLSAPSVNAGADKVLCSNDTTRLGSAPVAGISYSWSPTTGLSSPAASSTSVLLSNNINAPIYYTYILTASNAAGCSKSDTVIVKVNPLPHITISPNPVSVCPGDSASLTASGANTYTWSPSGGLSATSGSSVIVRPVTNSSYTVVGIDTNLCSGQASVTVSINTPPTVSAGRDTVVCSQSTPIQLTGSPTGGSWSGSGISSSGAFIPSVTGNFTVYYSFTDANGCKGIDTAVIHVVTPTIASAGRDSSLCQSSGPIQLTGSPSGGTWSGTSSVSSSGVFTPATSGIYQLIYTYGSGSCANRDTAIVRVNPNPVASVSPSAASICSGQSVTLTGSGGGSYAWSPPTGLSSVTGAIVTASPTNNTSYTLVVTDSNNCQGSSAATVTVYSLPSVSAGPDIQVCNQPIAVQLTGTPAGGSWTGTGITSTGSFTPPGLGNYPEYYSYTDAHSCTNRDTAIISVIAPSQANAGNDTSVCQSLSLQMSGSPSGGTWSGTVVSPSGLVNTATSGVYVLTYTYGTGNCATTDQVSVTVYSLPSIAAHPSSSALCTGDSILLYATGGVTYSWASPVPSGSANNDSIYVSPQAVTSYSVIGTDAHGCRGTSSASITVNPLPVVSAGPDTQACNQPLPVHLTGSPAGGTWSGPGISASGDFLPSGTGTFTEVYSYTSGAGCVNWDTALVTVISANPANAGPDTFACQNTGTGQLRGLPSGGTWSGNGVSPSGSFGTSNPGTYTLVYTYGGGNCVTHDTMILSIRPQPSVTISPASVSLCFGDSVVLRASGADSYVWSPLSGLHNAAADSVICLPNSTGTYYVAGTVTATGCTGYDSVAISVKPRPQVTNYPLRTDICSSSASVPLILQSSVASTTFSWTSSASSALSGYASSGNGNIPSQTISNSDTIVHFVYYAIQPTANGCAGPIAIDTIAVKPIPGISLPPDQTICSGDSSSIAYVQILISGTSVSWSAAAASPLSGYTASGLGDIPPQHIINSGSGPGSVSYSVYDTLNGCGGPSGAYVITVNPSPTVQFSLPNQSICSGVTTSAVALSSPTSGASISWTATIPPGLLGAAASGTTSIPASTLVNTTNTTLTLIYRAQASTTNVLCPGATAIYQVIVYPRPDVNAQIVNDTICSGNLIDISISSNVSGTQFTWTVNAPSQVSGASSGNGNSIHQNLTNSDAIPHGVTYQITTSASGCPGDDTTVAVVVNPSPTTNFSIPNQTICSGSSTQAVTLSSTTSGSMLAWSATIPASITGAQSSGQGIIPSSTLTNTSSSIQTITYTASSSYLGCAGPNSQYHVTINPTPHVTNTDSVIGVCSGDTVNLISLSSDVAATGFAWTGSPPASLSGYVSTGSTNFIPAQVITNTAFLPDTLTYTISPSANGCPGPVRKIWVIVKPVPQISLSPDTQTLCSGNASTPIVISSTILGTNFQWTGATHLVAGFVPSGNSSFIPSMTLANVSPMADTGFVSYMVVPQASGCPGATKTSLIRVNTKPISDFAINQSILCSPSPVTVATDGMVKGHADSLSISWGDGGRTTVLPNPGLPLWSNASHTFSNPSFASDTFSISVTAYNSCGDSTLSRQVIVRPNTINAFFNTSVTQGCAPLAVSFTDFSNGPTIASWCFNYDTMNHVCIGPGQVTAPHATVSHVFSAGTYVVALFVNDGCSFDTAYQQIIVRDSTHADFSLSNNICEGALAVFHDSSYAASGSLINGYSWSFGDGDSSFAQSPVHSYDTSGAFSACLTISSSFGCTSTTCKPISIIPRPKADFADSNVCVNSQAASFTNLSSGGLFYAWNFGDGNTDNVFNPRHLFTDSGTYIVSLIVSNAGCNDTVSHPITIYPKPAAGFSLPVAYACGVPVTISLSNSASGANGYVWDFGNGQSSTSVNPSVQFTQQGSFTITQIASNVYHCADTASHALQVYPYPAINSLAIDSSDGCQPLTVSLSATVANGITYAWDWGDNTGLESGGSQISHMYSDTGTYSITLYSYSNPACGDTLALPGAVRVYVRPVADFVFVADSGIYPLDGTIDFTNASSNASQYAWNFGDGTQSIEANPIHRYETVNDFSVELIATSEHGCKDTISKTLFVLKKALYVPNALFPDYGGFDTLVRIWKPVGIGLRAYHAAVYDKWGKLLWESSLLNNTQPAEWWNGTYNDQQCPQDVYVWKVDAVFMDGEIWKGMTYSQDEGGGTKRIGSITLIR